MIVNLKPTGFPFFKVLISFVYLMTSIYFPLTTFINLVIIFFSKVHTLGAFMAMWRSKKLTWIYVSWMSLLLVVISYLGINVISTHVMAFIAFSLFTFHFIYDEYELQEEGRTFENLIILLAPMTLMYMILFRDYLGLFFNETIFIVVTLFFFILEAIYIRKINWIFISSKIIVLFLLLSVYYGRDYNYVYFHILMIHYFFWLAFPIYKLDKYAKEDRDDFIMMFILLIFMSAFVYSTSIWASGRDAPVEILTKTFYIATIVHIFSTAPFGYIFGLKRKTYVVAK